MQTIEDEGNEEDLETLIVKNEILAELAAEVVLNITDTRTLFMEEFERIQIENFISHQEEIEREAEEYKELYEENRLMFEEERIENQKRLVEELEKMIKGREKLMKLNRKEKEARKITDEIFEVVRIWTDIDLVFGQLFGMREALRMVSKEDSKLVNKIKCRMVSRVNVIKVFHNSNKEILNGILESTDEFLDFVELGLDIKSRSGIVIVLNSMKNVPFWTLENEELIDKGIDNIKETILEIRNQLFQLPLCQLRPRRSIRQTLWDEIDSYAMLNDVSVEFESLQIK